MKEEKELIERYFRWKYPEERYQFKHSFVIGSAWSKKFDLFVIEFVDTKVKHPKTLELTIHRFKLERFGKTLI